MLFCPKVCYTFDERTTLRSCVRFQVLKAASMTITVFWDAVPCSLAERSQRPRTHFMFVALFTLEVNTTVTATFLREEPT
jgi:hypothetical protein